MFCTIVFIGIVMLIDYCYQCLLLGATGAGISALYRGINALGNGVYKALEGVQAGLVSTV